jgi:hypothetical protein
MFIHMHLNVSQNLDKLIVCLAVQESVIDSFGH